MKRADEEEARKIENTMPATSFSERERRNANDLDVVPTLVTFETFSRIVVAAIACDYCYFVTMSSESSGKIREVLCRGDHIRVEALIEEKDPQVFLTTDYTDRSERSV